MDQISLVFSIKNKLKQNLLLNNIGNVKGFLYKMYEHSLCSSASTDSSPLVPQQGYRDKTLVIHLLTVIIGIQSRDIETGQK